MCNLEALGANVDGVVNDGRYILNVLAVNNGVDGEWQVQLFHPAGNVALLRDATLVARNSIRIFRLRILNR